MMIVSRESPLCIYKIWFGLKMIQNLRTSLWLIISGIAATVAALLTLFRSVHSSELVSNLALIVVLPFGFLSKWGSQLSDFVFWLAFIIAQTAYLTCIYFVAKAFAKLVARGSSGDRPPKGTSITTTKEDRST
jgi:hypothetical protein